MVFAWFSSWDALPMMNAKLSSNVDKSARNPEKGSLCPDFTKESANSTRCGGPVGRPCSKKQGSWLEPGEWLLRLEPQRLVQRHRAQQPGFLERIALLPGEEKGAGDRI